MTTLRSMIRLAFLPSLLILILSVSSADKKKSDQFDLMNLIGKWEGTGSFLVPVTGGSVDIEGEGTFVYDSRNDRIRTSMSGSKFMLTYSDSGYLQLHPETDSVSWEVWDSWGKHALYWGVIDHDTLKADRRYKNKGYQMRVTFPHPDTLDFRLKGENKDGSMFDKATFLLWRVR